MKFQLYKDQANEYRWRLIASNNSDIIADSAEGYKNKDDCKKGIELVQNTNENTPIVDEENDEFII